MPNRVAGVSCRIDTVIVVTAAILNLRCVLKLATDDERRQDESQIFMCMCLCELNPVLSKHIDPCANMLPHTNIPGWRHPDTTHKTPFALSTLNKTTLLASMFSWWTFNIHGNFPCKKVSLEDAPCENYMPNYQHKFNAVQCFKTANNKPTNKKLWPTIKCLLFLFSIKQWQYNFFFFF